MYARVCGNKQAIGREIHLLPHLFGFFISDLFSLLFIPFFLSFF